MRQELVHAAEGADGGAVTHGDVVRPGWPPLAKIDPVPHAAIVRHVRPAMRRFSDPIRGPPRRHPRCRGETVTFSRKTLRSPMTSLVRSPAYFRSWGSIPRQANGKIRFPAPMVVGPSTTAACAGGNPVRCGHRRRRRRRRRPASRSRGPPADRPGPSDGSGPARSWRPRGGSGHTVDHGGEDLGLGDAGPVHRRRAPSRAERERSCRHLDLEAHLVPRHHRAPETRLVDCP